MQKISQDSINIYSLKNQYVLQLKVQKLFSTQNYHMSGIEKNRNLKPMPPYAEFVKLRFDNQVIIILFYHMHKS